jgi:hypothetical protein
MRYRIHNFGNQGPNAVKLLARVPSDVTYLDLGLCNFNEKGFPTSHKNLAEVFSAIPRHVKEVNLIHNFSSKGRYRPAYTAQQRTFAEWSKALAALPNSVEALWLHVEDIKDWSMEECALIGQSLHYGISLFVVDYSNTPVENNLVVEIKRHIGASVRKNHQSEIIRATKLPTVVASLIEEYANAATIEEARMLIPEQASSSFKSKLLVACAIAAPIVTLCLVAQGGVSAEQDTTLTTALVEGISCFGLFGHFPLSADTIPLETSLELGMV